MPPRILRATLTWNGTVLKCNHALKSRTALLQQAGFDQLHLTLVPQLKQTGSTSFLLSPLVFPDNKRLRFQLLDWKQKKNGNLVLVLQRACPEPISKTPRSIPRSPRRSSVSPRQPAAH